MWLKFIIIAAEAVLQKLSRDNNKTEQPPNFFSTQSPWMSFLYVACELDRRGARVYRVSNTKRLSSVSSGHLNLQTPENT